MSKPMLVTWPLVMLLLDDWPLHRISLESGDAWKSLVMEKVSFLLLALGFSLLTYIAQEAGGAVAGFSSWVFAPRIQNAITAYAGYLKKVFWPADLAAYYPFSKSIPLTMVT